MPFEITHKNGFFLIDFLEKADLNAFISSYYQLIEHPDFQPQSNTMWDFRKVLIDMSITDIQKIAAKIVESSVPRSNRARSAFLVIDPNDRSTLENYVTATAHYPVEFRIFSDYQLAKNWLFGGN